MEGIRIFKVENFENAQEITVRESTESIVEQWRRDHIRSWRTSWFKTWLNTLGLVANVLEYDYDNIVGFTLHETSAEVDQLFPLHQVEFMNRTPYYIIHLVAYSKRQIELPRFCEIPLYNEGLGDAAIYRDQIIEDLHIFPPFLGWLLAHPLVSTMSRAIARYCAERRWNSIPTRLAQSLEETYAYYRARHPLE